MYVAKFTDTLFGENRDNFFKLIAKVDVLKHQFKTERRRVKPTNQSIVSYSPLKIVSRLLATIRDSRTIRQDKAIDSVKSVVLHLNALSRSLSEYYETVNLRNKISQLATIAFSLLPKGETLQLELFDVVVYHTDKKALPTTSGFRKWLKYLFATPRLGLNYASVISKSTFKVYNLSIEFSYV